MKKVQTQKQSEAKLAAKREAAAVKRDSNLAYSRKAFSLMR